MPGKDSISELKADYRLKNPLISRRLAEFREVYEKGDRAIFEELCFCILTAGSSAKMGMRTIAALRDILQSGTEKELQAAGPHLPRAVLAPASVLYLRNQGVSQRRVRDEASSAP